MINLCQVINDGHFFSLVAIVASFQAVLNSKGTCKYLDPKDHVDKFFDWGYHMTYDLNGYLVANPDIAEAAQALSKFISGREYVRIIDCRCIKTFYCATVSVAGFIHDI